MQVNQSIFKSDVLIFVNYHHNYYLALSMDIFTQLNLIIALKLRVIIVII